MARFRLSSLARSDLAQILAVSADRWGLEGGRRYAALLTAAMRKIAAQPDGAATRDRAELSHGVRSLHLRHARVGDGEARVRQPVHVLFYRVVRPGLMEIVRAPTSGWSQAGTWVPSPTNEATAEQVWLWNEYPKRWARDCGIDLVFTNKDGKTWAVQAKCYASTYEIRKSDVDKFLSESNRRIIDNRLLITTTDWIGENAKQVLDA